ncbi:hypothetical protein HMPREF0519_0465, partial [Lentilactobacillus hilgardii DSM 20176 = ATCC 8290]
FRTLIIIRYNYQVALYKGIQDFSWQKCGKELKKRQNLLVFEK